MNIITNARHDRCILDITPENDEPEFICICPDCAARCVALGYITEHDVDPDVRIFSVADGYTWEQVQRLAPTCGNPIH
jgi:hypothetical protein